jgi:predicted AAA+ superfamily ATPase
MYRQVLRETGMLLDRENPPIVLILGLRQVGKSTLAKTVCTNRPAVFFNFDLVSDIAEFTGRDRHSLALFASRYKDHIIVVDEIQKSPEATGIVKHLHDNYKLPFLLTGSSELKIRAHIGDSLAGRLREIRLYPLSLNEIDMQQNMPFDARSEFNNYEFNQQMMFRAHLNSTRGWIRANCSKMPSTWASGVPLIMQGILMSSDSIVPSMAQRLI